MNKATNSMQTLKLVFLFSFGANTILKCPKLETEGGRLEDQSTISTRDESQNIKPKTIAASVAIKPFELRSTAPSAATSQRPVLRTTPSRSPESESTIVGSVGHASTILGSPEKRGMKIEDGECQSPGIRDGSPEAPKSEPDEEPLMFTPGQWQYPVFKICLFEVLGTDGDKTQILVHDFGELFNRASKYQNLTQTQSINLLKLIQKFRIDRSEFSSELYQWISSLFDSAELSFTPETGEAFICKDKEDIVCSTVLNIRIPVNSIRRMKTFRYLEKVPNPKSLKSQYEILLRMLP